jgi:hypothetical protein
MFFVINTEVVLEFLLNLQVDDLLGLPQRDTGTKNTWYINQEVFSRLTHLHRFSHEKTRIKSVHDNTNFIKLGIN